MGREHKIEHPLPDTVPESRDRLYTRARVLAGITIAYNLVEGLVSMFFGASDETLALFGFGIDSFIEVISAIGIWHMLQRISVNAGETRDEFERRALRITGSAFYLLTAGLILTATVNLLQGHKPDTTLWGIIIALVSITCMWLLIRAKVRVGTALASPAILADAACSRTCLYLSVILLISSGGYALTGIGSLDAVGAALIAWLSWKEGREAFAKAKGDICSCGCQCSDEETV